MGYKYYDDKFPFHFMNPSLPLEKRIDDLLARLTIKEKIELLPTRQKAIPRLGINEFWVGGEAAHGLAWRGVATVYTQPIGLVCSFDKELMKRIGEAISDEARAFYRRLDKRGGLCLWAPTIDMARDPRWGRTEESYGEDPFLAGEMAAKFIQGMQGQHPFYLKTAATPKHFFANNNEYERASCSAEVSQRNMREYYLDVFKRAITKGKASCIMTAYNAVNGVPCNVNPIVKDIVKHEWKLSGFVVTDAVDFTQTVTMHHYFDTYYEAAAASLKNGVDCFTDDPKIVIEAFNEAYERGLINQEDIDRALRNIFRIRFRLGEFDPDELNPYSQISDSEICHKDHAKLSYMASQKSIVLLKNQKNILPIDKSKKQKIAVIGPLANEVFLDHYSGSLPYKVTPLQGILNKQLANEIYFDTGNDEIAIKSVLTNRYLSAYKTDSSPLFANGLHISDSQIFSLDDWGWGSYTIRSKANNMYLNAEDNGFVKASSKEIIGWFVKQKLRLEKIENDLYIIKTWNDKCFTVDAENNNIIKFEDFKDLDSQKFKIECISKGIEKASEIASLADICVVFLGNNPFINGKEEYDRPDIILPYHQEELLKAIYEKNPNTVLFIIGSYPFAINWADQNIPAILYTAHSGQEMGNAIADVLFGDYSPAGRLNMTWYKSINQLPPIMDYDIINNHRTYMYFDDEVLYPFGHGLTYTKFEYIDIIVNNEIVEPNKSIKLIVRVKNAGDIESDEVIQVYIKAENSKYKRPNKQLKGFERIHLLPKQEMDIEFEIPYEELSIWNESQGCFIVEDGYITLMIGTSSQDIRLTKKVKVIGEKLR
ncbi:glycoside hydrolase family 3 C-terminal domain-containing protein [Caldicellulosiruptoraceae bacterium PP1]